MLLSAAPSLWPYRERSLFFFVDRHNGAIVFGSSHHYLQSAADGAGEEQDKQIVLLHKNFISYPLS